MVSIDKNIFNFKIILNEQKKLVKSSEDPEMGWNLDRSTLFDPSFHRIWIIISGNGIVKTHLGELSVSENHAYYLPPYSIISTKLSSDMDQYYIDFIQDVSKTPLSQLYEFNFIDETNSFDVIFALAKSLENAKKNDEVSKLMISSAITNILTHFIKSKKPFHAKLYNAIDYISNHYAENLSLTYLANICDYSYEYFSMKFKKTFSQTPQEYIINLRMTKAKQLLLLTKDSVGEIGSKVGYPDPTHFSKIFKHENGVSPQTYREIYSNGI